MNLNIPVKVINVVEDKSISLDSDSDSDSDSYSDIDI